MERTKRVLQNFICLAQDLRKSSPLLLLLLCLAPLCLVVWVLQNKNDKLEMLVQKTEALEQKAISAHRLKTKQQTLWQHVQQSNPRYLEQVVEALPLLKSELHRVQALARQYPENRQLQERLSYLQGDQNRIRFVPSTERSGSFFQETELKMQNGVQMNEDDLKSFLTSIEETAEGRPLLIVKNLEIKKLKEKADETVYVAQVEIIKRLP